MSLLMRSIRDGAAYVTSARGMFCTWETYEEANGWGSWTALDEIELGDEMFSFIVNENDDHRWNRLALLGLEKWVEWGTP